MKALLVMATLLLFAGPAAACPMCAETVAENEQVDRSGGFNAAIWTMIGAAATGVGCVAGVVVRRPK